MIPGSGRSPGVGIGYPLQYPWASLVAHLVKKKKKICLQCRRPGFNPWLGKSPGEGKGYPLQISGLENSLNCIAHGVAKSRTRLSDLHFHFLRKYVNKKRVRCRQKKKKKHTTIIIKVNIKGTYKIYR